MHPMWKLVLVFGVLGLADGCLSRCKYKEYPTSYDCTGCDMQGIDPKDFPKGAIHITDLLLVSTGLNDLKSNTFSKTPNLLKLSLRNNQLTTLHYDLFSMLSQLLTLDLSFNYLTTLHDERLFRNQRNLKTLLLEKNQILYINFNVMEPLTSVKDIILAGNQFDCNCQLLLFMSWCKSKNLNVKIKCSYPENYKGINWSELEFSKLCEIFPTTTTTTNGIADVTKMTDEILTTDASIAVTTHMNVSELLNTTIDVSNHTSTGMKNMDRMSTNEESTNVVTVVVSILLSVVILGFFISFYIWRNYKYPSYKTSEESEKNVNKLSDDYYYEEVSNLRQSVNDSSSPPDLPSRNVTDGGEKSPEGKTQLQVYDYISNETQRDNSENRSEMYHPTSASDVSYEQCQTSRGKTIDELELDVYVCKKNSLYGSD